jgi:selenoprotein W-related protein
VTLLASSGGVFEVVVNGEMIHSKRQTGVFPEETAVMQQLRERTVQIRPLPK